MKKSRLILLYLLAGCSTSHGKWANEPINLVRSNTWYIAGPVLEDEHEINEVRKRDGVIRVTANDAPVGEIELNVMITESNSNDGPPTQLSDKSTFVEITYRSSHHIKLQARQGDTKGVGCLHGGSHPRVELPASTHDFKTLRIPWLAFKQDGKPDGQLLNIDNLCKFNFVNYNPIPGASLEILSVKIENFN